jgi:hypothetical protein
LGTYIYIGNDGDAANKFALDAYIPEGTYGNPQELKVGDNEVELEAGHNGYYFDWTAPCAGTVTIVVTGDNWAYSINLYDAEGNNLDYRGGYFVNGSENTITYEVTAGQYLSVWASVYDGSWPNPAGKVNVNISFEPAEGEEYPVGLLGDVNGDDFVDVEDAMLILQLDAFILEESDLNMDVADVSGDGLVDVEDAMLILQFDAFLIEQFPAEN